MTLRSSARDSDCRGAHRHRHALAGRRSDHPNVDGGGVPGAIREVAPDGRGRPPGDARSASGAASTRREHTSGVLGTVHCSGPLSVGFPLLSAEEQARLVERIRTGDRDAEGRLVEHFARAIRVMARIRARALDDEDLTQEVLIAALSALRRGQLRDTERLPQFVAGIARNVINNRLRRARGPVHEPIEEHEFPAPVADLTHELARRERAATLRQALESLSADDRRILMLTLVGGLKPGEIAERLGLGEDVVRTRKSRAIKRLKERVTNGRARTTSNKGPEP